MDRTAALRILHLEDDANDAEIIHRALKQGNIPNDVQLVTSRDEYLRAMESGGFDLILSDNQVPGLDGLGALQIARQCCPNIPFLFASGHLGDADRVEKLKRAGATDCIPKSDLPMLAAAVLRALSGRADRAEPGPGMNYRLAMERLVTVVQELSLARDLETLMGIVRRAARELTGADGATFILRENEQCHYADEDAIAPLWKGRRFPMEACISGWAMLNRRQAVIEDIYSDARIPQDAYRSTFVKSLVMVPIRTLNPIGAIGNYWAERHLATADEVKVLQALADTTAVAMENIQVYADLEQRVLDRTAELEAANRELEAFSYAVSHDLRAPLRHIDGFAQMLVQDHSDRLNEKGLHYLTRIGNATQRMGQIIEDLLTLSRTTQATMTRGEVDLARIAREIASDLAAATPQRQVDCRIAGGLSAQGDTRLLRVALENLLSNAWKYTANCSIARIEVGSIVEHDGRTAFYVRDNGAGFEMKHAGKLFGVFQRLHSQREFPGTGVGLATVQRIVHKHGGQIRAEAEVDKGATFYFTLG